MPLNEEDRQSVINALNQAAIAVEAARLELEKIKTQLMAILNDVRD